MVTCPFEGKGHPQGVDLIKAFALSAGVILVDQLSKALAQSGLSHGQATEVLDGLLRFTLTLNPGGLFGIHLGGSRFLTLLSLIVGIVVVYYLWTTPKKRSLERISLSLILGGAVGNIIDRIRLGGVIDFIDVGYQEWRWPVFNGADLAVTVGVVLLLGTYTFRRRGVVERQWKKVVPARAKKMRLDLYLLKEGIGLSRSQIDRLIDQGKVLVDGQPTKHGHFVRPHEQILVTIPGPERPVLVPEDIPVEILYEDDHLVVVNKPAGMVVHPGAGNPSGTLVNALLHYCGQLSSLGGPFRPGIVHRLDKGTSGIMVLAKTDEAYLGLAEQIQRRSVGRRYLALVWGKFEQRWGKIEVPIGRHRVDRKRMAVTRAGGREAVTSYEVLEEFAFCSYLSLELETGRTHQIRVHLFHLGHPVFGDPKYGGRTKRLGTLGPGERGLASLLLTFIDRQALHAASLRFVHPQTGQTLDFSAEPPVDINTILTHLRQSQA